MNDRASLVLGMSSGLLRRNARLRKEYLYRKSLEGVEAEQYEKKRKIRKALEEGKPLPTELRSEEASLRREIALEDDNTAVPRTHIDDEYANAGAIPPKVLITTSRDPSSRLAQFAKELKLVFPNAQRLNRGGLIVKDLVESARAHEFTDIVVVHEHRYVRNLPVAGMTSFLLCNALGRGVYLIHSLIWRPFLDIHRGEPDGMVVCHLPFGPTTFFGLSNVVCRHDIGDKREVGTVSGAYPHLIFDGFSGKLGERVKCVLRHLFPAVKQEDSAKGRVMTFANHGRDDFISFRHHAYVKGRDGPGKNAIELTEKVRLTLLGRVIDAIQSACLA